MNRYFIELAYEGTNYHGWQVQPNALTVQETIEKAISTLLKEKISIVGAGRTDTGVHASFFIAHFDMEERLKISLADLIYKLNRFLPADIAIYSIYPVENEMHARFSAKYRKYRYTIRNKKALFNREFSVQYNGELDLKLMNEACDYLFQYKDFTSFSKLHTDVKTNDCIIIEAQWYLHEDDYIFEIKADRFLRNMVRSLVGTMIEIGAGKMSLDEFKAVIEAKDRSKAGMSAEAKGLMLVDIGY